MQRREFFIAEILTDYFYGDRKFKYYVNSGIELKTPTNNKLLNLSNMMLLSCQESPWLLFGLLIRLLAFFWFLCWNTLICDETLTYLNAQSLAETGRDIFGQRLPIYFNSWLVGGQSPLSTYICALSIKLLGVNTVALRLPQFIVGCFSFIYFNKLVNLLFNKKSANLLIGIEMLSAQAIWTCIYQFDCHWMSFLINFGLYNFFYGIKNNRKLFIYLSSVFFALSFYSYIASVLIIPVLLISLYLIQLKLKNIKLKDIILNFIIVLIISIPFILFGLSALNLININTIGPMTIPDMSEYTRYKYITNFSFNYALQGAFCLISNYDPLSLTHRNALMSLFTLVLFAFILFLFNNKKINNKYKNNKEIFIPALTSVLSFVLFSGTSVTAIYRYGAFCSLITLALSPVLFKLFKKVRKQEFIALIMIGFFVFSLAEYNKVLDSLTFQSAPVTAACEYIEQIYPDKKVYCYVAPSDEQDNIIDYQKQYEQVLSIQIRGYYGNKGFINFKEEQEQRYYSDNNKLIKISDKYFIANDISLIPKNSVVLITDNTINLIEAETDFKFWVPEKKFQWFNLFKF